MNFPAAFILLAILCHAGQGQQPVLSLGEKPAWFDEPQVMTDVPPSLKTPLEIRYPEPAKKRRVQGTAIISVAIDERGIPIYAELAASAGYAPYDTAALHAVFDADFKPAKRNGRPVAARITMPVQFRVTQEDGDAGKTVEELELDKKELEVARRQLMEEQRKIEEEKKKLEEELRRMKEGKK